MGEEVVSDYLFPLYVPLRLFVIFPSDITLIVAVIVTRKGATCRPEDPVLNPCRYKELLILALALALLEKAQKGIGPKDK